MVRERIVWRNKCSTGTGTSQVCYTEAGIADPHHADVDPEPAFLFDAEPDPDPTIHSGGDPYPTFQLDADPDPTT